MADKVPINGRPQRTPFDVLEHIENARDDMEWIIENQPSQLDADQLLAAYDCLERLNDAHHFVQEAGA